MKTAGIPEIEVKLIRQSAPPWTDAADTLSIRDIDGREIVIRRIEIPELIKKLRREEK